MELARAAQVAGQMKAQADQQAAKFAELGRERDILLKMRNKVQDSNQHQVGVACTGPGCWHVPRDLWRSGLGLVQAAACCPLPCTLVGAGW